MSHIVKGKPTLHLFVLIVVCLAAFANTLTSDFVWEDLDLIVGNYHIRDSRNIPLFFSAEHWEESRSTSPDTGFRPLRETSFTIDYLIWELNPFGFHLTNLLLHIINVILVYYLTMMLIASIRKADQADAVIDPGFLSPVFLTALFFALHPIHTESVSYIKNRSDLLAFVFFQSSCLMFIFHHLRSEKKERLISYLGALICFVLALWSKPMAISLPMVLILYMVCFPREQSLSRPAIHVLPFLGLAVVYFWLQNTFLVGAGAGKIGFDFGSWRHISTILKTLGLYLKMLVLPMPLKLYHVFHPPVSIFDFTVVLSTAALLVIFVLMIKSAVIDRRWLFGLGWILITLLPVVNILVLFDRPIAEQRLYIPSFGFCLLLALGISVMIKRIRSKREMDSWPFYVIVGGICAIYMVITIQRNFEWRDGVSLFSGTVSQTPELAWAHNNLADALKEKGRLDEAVSRYQTSLILNPEQANIYNSIGASLGEKGQLPEAVSYFETALRIQPEFVLARDNLGLALHRQGRLEESVHHYRKALDLQPENAGRHVHLAEVLKEKGAFDEACRHFARAWEIDPVIFPLPSECLQ